MKEAEARKAKRQIQVGLLFHAGESIPEIAKRVGCHRNTVRDDLEAMGMIPPRPAGRPRKHAAAQQETPDKQGRIGCGQGAVNTPATDRTIEEFSHDRF
ncbi:helix-turn-helix DNA binding domain protein [Gordonia phage BearBQ]|nr:helix-turn-helix DNA binding domain protein [Gordonia phage BearBQ]